MKKRKILIVVSIIAVVAALTLGVSAAKSNMSAKQEVEAKTNILLATANEDLLDSFNFNSDSYISFTDAKIDAIADLLSVDSEKALEIASILDDLYYNPPVGSTKPIYVVKEDLSEIYVLYKDKDGKNICESSIEDKNGRIKDHQQKQGEPILDFDSIKVD